MGGEGGGEVGEGAGRGVGMVGVPVIPRCEHHQWRLIDHETEQLRPLGSTAPMATLAIPLEEEIPDAESPALETIKK